jgi:hypothetical protein
MNKVFITFLIIFFYLEILVNCKRPSECDLPRMTGPCRAMFPAFYFNSSLERCQEFSYGGCEGKRMLL